MLQGKTEEFVSGYKACKKDIETYLHESMKRNGGVVNGKQAFTVIDDLAMYLHVQNLQISKIEKQEHQEPVIFMIVDTQNIH